MRNKNSIALIKRDFNLRRNVLDSPFSGLSWEDTEMLFMTILSDMVIGLSKIPETDIIVFVKKSELHYEYISDVEDKVIVVDTEELNSKEILNYSINYLKTANYWRNILLMNYYPICDSTFYKNILMYLGEEQEHIFVAPMKDFTIGMIAFRHDNKMIFDDLLKIQVFDFEKFLEKFINYDAFLITPNFIPSIINVSDVINLKSTIEKMIRLKNGYPQNTYNLLKSFEKKYVIKNNNEIRHIRRYF